jgi:hypothetical protein
MAAAINRPNYCRFGLNCKRRETCSYIHPEQEYDNWGHFLQYESDYQNTQWPIDSYEHGQFEYDGQKSDLPSSHSQYSTDQNFSYYMTTQSQISSSSDVRTEIYNDRFDPNHQQNYSYNNQCQYNHQPNKLQTSKKPRQKRFTNYKGLDSESGFSNRNNYNQYTSVSSSLLAQLKNDIQVLFRVCKIFVITIASLLLSNCCFVGKST